MQLGRTGSKLVPSAHFSIASPNLSNPPDQELALVLYTSTYTGVIHSKRIWMLFHVVGWLFFRYEYAKTKIPATTSGMLRICPMLMGS